MTEGASPEAPAETPAGASDDLTEAYAGLHEDSKGLVYVAAYGPIEWPMGTRVVQSILIAVDGAAQYAERDDSGTVLELREGEADFERMLGVLSAAWPETAARRTGDPEVIREDHPGFVLVCAALRGEPPQFWQGPEEDLPAPWRAIIEETRSQLAGLPLRDDRNVAAWLLAELLAPEIAAEKRRAGVVEAIDDAELARSPKLEEALAHPFRLVAIPAGENPFTPLSWTAYTAGRSTANVAWGDGVFHVRPLRDASTQK